MVFSTVYPGVQQAFPALFRPGGFVVAAALPTTFEIQGVFDLSALPAAQRALTAAPVSRTILASFTFHTMFEGPGNHLVAVALP